MKPIVVGAENRWEKEFETLFFACKSGHVSLFIPCLVLKPLLLDLIDDCMMSQDGGQDD